MKITTVMYHYVRELSGSKYPEINALLTSEFRNQINFFKKNYTFINIQDCVDALREDCVEELPSNSILLTFDDAIIDHYTNVFPILEDEKIQGVFFPPSKPVSENIVLDIHKIHYIIASTSVENILSYIYTLLDEFREIYKLESNEYYFTKLALKSRYDSKEVIFIKRLLQAELSNQLRWIITDKLFNKYVSSDEKSFSYEQYMTLEQLQCMAENGMHIGGHGYNHYWLERLSIEEQEKEIDLTLSFLGDVGVKVKDWVMCYPFGSFNQSLIDIQHQSFFCSDVLFSCNDRIYGFYFWERLDWTDA